MTAFQPFGDRSSAVQMKFPAALLMRMSIWPNASIASRDHGIDLRGIADVDGRRDRVDAIGVEAARPASRCSADRLAMTMRAPSLPSARAMASPMPVPPPVTIAVCPSSTRVANINPIVYVERPVFRPAKYGQSEDGPLHFDAARLAAMLFRAQAGRWIDRRGPERRHDRREAADGGEQARDRRERHRIRRRRLEQERLDHPGGEQRAADADDGAEQRSATPTRAASCRRPGAAARRTPGARRSPPCGAPPRRRSCRTRRRARGSARGRRAGSSSTMRRRGVITRSPNSASLVRMRSTSTRGPIDCAVFRSWSGRFAGAPSTAHHDHHRGRDVVLASAPAEGTPAPDTREVDASGPPWRRSPTTPMTVHGV